MAQSYFAKGQWNFYCDLCGAKRKSGEGIRTWDNFYVCRSHKEVRNPQDFVRGIRDDQSVPWSRPKAADNFVSLTWERNFDEQLAAADTHSLIVSAFIPTGILSAATDPINSHAINAAAPLIWFGPTAAESLTLSEALSVQLTVAVASAVGAGEVVSSGPGLVNTLSDAAATSDSLSTTFSPTLSDTVTVAEAPTQQILTTTQLNGSVLNGAALNAN